MTELIDDNRGSSLAREAVITLAFVAAALHALRTVSLVAIAPDAELHKGSTTALYLLAIAGAAAAVLAVWTGIRMRRGDARRPGNGYAICGLAAVGLSVLMVGATVTSTVLAAHAVAVLVMVNRR